ncbi:helix-turn-helix transcriptional regulator [Actinokineospora auranticolor]|uniref:Helix-turn-helix protein n=1 Tax=Actinokineospora auranticolor TaxID=155976 RepID=A0A2S6GDD9_9PSEU|nr:helix-turn-helix transcriptional regulator [Actinokineospora auranticolor]PPK63254.1 helix-turn-helix protein [Actinokineospora auranticolor]
MDTELGSFLRTRRACLTPAEVGLTSYGARRVPGLRREELAQLAGVSATYYTRLEQGQSQNASDDVLDAIARALRLNEDESSHLRALARPTRKGRKPAPRTESARPALTHLIGAMSGVAAVVLDRRSDILAWNPLAHRLLAGHCAADSPASPATRPNQTRMLFLDEHTRDLYAEWDHEAKRAVAALRLLAGQHPNDRHLAELVGELCVKSTEFSALWSRHPVLNCTFGTKHFAHPAVGPLELHFEVLHTPDNSAQRVLVYSAEPDTASEAALGLLAADPMRDHAAR